jgi:DNA-binding transcriptional MocR family regulator
MSPGATFERVYLALKEQILGGRFGPGEHIEPAALSQDLNASITPVRDALHRLVGEGLVEAPRGDGFRTPFVTEMGLRHLYRWNAALLDLAARSRPERIVPREPSSSPGDLLQRVETLFLLIASRPGSPEHLAAVARLNERLRRIRTAELGLVPDAEREAAALGAAIEGGAADALRRLLATYHRRRERLAAEIVEALQPLR